MIQGVVFGEKELAAKLFLDIFGDVGPFVRLIVLIEQTYFVGAQLGFIDRKWRRLNILE